MKKNLFEEMTNASALSEKKPPSPPLRQRCLWMTPIDGPDFFKMMKEAGGPDWTSPI